MTPAAYWRPRLRVGAVVAGTVLLFLFAIQLLGTATQALSPTLRPALERIIEGRVSALGISWLTAYGLLNGSVVAAVAISLFDAQLVTAGQLFAMVVGSRLGAAAIVVLIGGLDYVQKPGYSLRRATSLGVLTFVVTHTVYLPVALLGIVVLPRFELEVLELGDLFVIEIRWFAFFTTMADWITQLLGPTLAFLVAFGLLVTSMRLFDEAFVAVERERLDDRIFEWLRRPIVSFAIGLVVTGVTTSVAFSLGIVVPLFNRNVITRREIVPYILGASIGTLTDTLLVAFALESSVGVLIVVLVAGAATFTTALALGFYEAYLSAVGLLHDRIQADPRVFAGVILGLVVVPATLVFVPL